MHKRLKTVSSYTARPSRPSRRGPVADLPAIKPAARRPANAPCSCGSGRKYKRCCKAKVEEIPTIGAFRAALIAKAISRPWPCAAGHGHGCVSMECPANQPRITGAHVQAASWQAAYDALLALLASYEPHELELIAATSEDIRRHIAAKPAWFPLPEALS